MQLPGPRECTNMLEQDDTILLKRLQEGDETAFSDIYTRYSEYLVLEAAFHLRDPMAARDMVQDMFTQWWHNRTLHNLVFKEKVTFKTYLKQSVRYNCSRSNLMQTKKQASVQTLYRIQEKEQIENPEPAISEEMDRKIKKYLNELPPMPRQALTKVYLEELQRKDITHELNITAKTLRNHLNRGINMLRQKLNNSL